MVRGPDANGIKGKRKKKKKKILLGFQGRSIITISCDVTYW